MSSRWWWMPEMKPLINDRLFREELARLESEGLAEPVQDVVPSDGTYPPASGGRQPERSLMAEEQVVQLREAARSAGIELINDGAVYRAKRQRDFMIWTLETSPLTAEEMGGGESNALWEIYCRFIDISKKS